MLSHLAVYTWCDSLVSTQMSMLDWKKRQQIKKSSAVRLRCHQIVKRSNIYLRFVSAWQKGNECTKRACHMSSTLRASQLSKAFLETRFFVKHSCTKHIFLTQKICSVPWMEDLRVRLHLKIIFLLACSQEIYISLNLLKVRLSVCNIALLISLIR